ncbi:MAG: ribosome biogenesis GTPase Der [Myxococcales bacterium]|nr:ribosome biogenesis GTPase Der [Myxococcales bacterium]
MPARVSPAAVLPIVAIVGRPNVGKSTLFNRLLGEKRALVHDRPGVTRDRNYHPAAWLEHEFMLVDTGGFEPEPGDKLFASMREQSETAIGEADVVIFLVDAQSGRTPADEATARIVRQSSKPVVVAVNKCDDAMHDDLAAEFWSLGLDEVLPVSAEHGRGLWELMSAVVSRFPAGASPEVEVEGEIRIAVLGRPNVGKSTLMNRLLGEERHIVHDMPGTTVDATDSIMELRGQRFRLVDTAGVRRRARVDDAVEQLAVGAALRTIERCHVVFVVLDGVEGPTEQDARLTGLVVERGRALVVLVNKWDAVRETEDRNITVLEDEFSRKLPHANFAPVLYISALTGKGCAKLLDLASEVFGAFNTRVSTARLNDFLRAAVAAHSPPQLHNHPIRYQYMTQVRVRPPTFCVFVNNPEGVVEHYDRFLKNRLREEFGFAGTPLKVEYRRRRRLGEARTDVMGEPIVAIDPGEEGEDAWTPDQLARGEDSEAGGEE